MNENNRHIYLFFSLSFLFFLSLIIMRDQGIVSRELAVILIIGAMVTIMLFSAILEEKRKPVRK